MPSTADSAASRWRRFRRQLIPRDLMIYYASVGFSFRAGGRAPPRAAYRDERRRPREISVRFRIIIASLIALPLSPR